MKLCLIVAMTEEGVIGKDGKIPWHISADLVRFKEITMGKPLIMGRKTYESIGRLLPGRTNIILTKNKSLVVEGAIVVHDFKEALAAAKKENTDEGFVIGGAEIYNLALPQVDRLYLTVINHPFEGDTYFPEFDLNEGFRILESATRQTNEEPIFPYIFITAERLWN